MRSIRTVRTMYTALAVALCCSGGIAHAQTNGTWTTTSAGTYTWTTTSNWSGSSVASGIDATATFSTAPTGIVNVSITDTQTIGNITGTSGNSFTDLFYNITGGTLNLDRGGAVPVITQDNALGNFQISSVITGTSGLTKEGSGRLTLSAANTYTGTTTVNNGTLWLQSSDPVITGALTINAGGTASVGAWNLGHYATADRVRTITINGGVLDARFDGQYALGAPDTVTMTGGTISGDGPAQVFAPFAEANTYNPIFTIVASPTTATISSGLALRMNSDSNNINFNVGAGSTPSGVDLLVSGPLAQSPSSFFAGGGIIKSGAGRMRLTNNNTYTGNTSVNAGILEIGDGGVTGSLPGSTAITGSAGGTLAFNRSDAYGGTFANQISGGMGVLLSGGTLTLSNANTYTGGSTISAGRLVVGNASALGASSGALAVNGGTLDLGGFNVSVGALSGSSGAVITTNNAAGTATLTSDFASGTSTFAGVIQDNGSGAVALTKSGAGTLVLSAANTYTGTTTVNNGTLWLQGSDPVIRGALTINAGGTVSVGGWNLGHTVTPDRVRTITINGGVLDARFDGFQYALGAPDTVTMTGGTISGGGPAQVFAPFADAGAYNPIFTIVASPTTATISSGLTLRMNSDSNNINFNVGAGSTPSGVDLLMSGPLAGFFGLFGGGGIIKSGEGRMRLTADSTYTGNTSVNAGILEIGGGGVTGSLPGSTAITGSAGGTLAFNRSDNYGGTFANQISGGLGLLLSGGTLALGGNNTFTGATAINAGVLAMNNAAALGTGTVTFGGGTLQYGPSITADLSARIAASSSAIAVDVGANDVTWATALAASNVGGLTKLGTGLLTFTGNNAYAGATAVDAGGLLVNGANGGSGLVTVANAARFGGDGSLAGGLTLLSGAQWIFNPFATLNVSGSVTLDNSFSVSSLVNADGTAINWAGISDGTYTLIGTTSTFNNIANFGAGNAADIGGGRTAYFQNGSLQLVIVPEPGALALAGLGIAAAAWGFRRRRRSPSKPGAEATG